MPTMRDIEDYARALGIPVEDAAQTLGMAIEKGIQPQVDALQQMASQAWHGPQKLISPTVPSGPSPLPDRNGATLSDQGNYEQDLRSRLLQLGNEENAKQQNVDSFNPDDYTKYAMGGEVAPHDEQLGKPKFNHLKELVKRHKKSNSEIKASNNPKEFLEKNKELNIKNRKGVAF